jgi:DNA-binding NarL/FixJ family response regulator
VVLGAGFLVVGARPAAIDIRADHPDIGVLVLSQYVEPGLAMKLLADSAEGGGYLRRTDDPLAQLTPREREAIELMAAGNSNQGIGDRLVITVRAVEKYVSSIFGKLGLPATGSESRRVLAVLLFLRN